MRERLKYLRETWGLSARKLSLELGLNAGAWFAYENGDSLPGAAVLTAICQKDVNINWLLTGAGSPFRQTSQDAPGVLTRLDEAQSTRLELGLLQLLAEKSGYSVRRTLIDFFSQHFPEAFTLTELSEALKLSPEVVVRELLTLQEEKVVCVLSQAPERYQGVGLALSTAVSTRADLSQLSLEALRNMLQEILPATEQQRGVILDAVAHVRDGRAFISATMQWLKDYASEHHDASGDKVRLILGAAVTGRGAEPSSADR